MKLNAKANEPCQSAFHCEVFRGRTASTGFLAAALVFAISLMLSDVTYAQTKPAIQATSSAAGKDVSPAFTTPAEQCIIPASTYHGINPWLLRAILRVESSLKPGAIGRNTNGTIDIGIGQINSMHLPELSKYGIDAGHLTDACICTYVSGWFLKKVIMERGNTWEGVASYHSRTPAFNQRYQRLLIAELQRSQMMAAYPSPMGAHQGANYSAPTVYGQQVQKNQQRIVTDLTANTSVPAQRDVEPGIVVFEQ